MTLAARFSRRLSSTQSIQLASEFLRYDMLRTLRYGMVSLKVSDFKVFLSGYIVNVRNWRSVTWLMTRLDSQPLCYTFGHPVMHSVILLHIRPPFYACGHYLTDWASFLHDRQPCYTFSQSVTWSTTLLHNWWPWYIFGHPVTHQALFDITAILLLITYSVALLHIFRMWWLSGRVGALCPQGRKFESRSSRHVGTLGESFTRSCLWRFACVYSDTVSMR